MNGSGKLRRCTECDAAAVDFYLSLAATFVDVRTLIRRAHQTYHRPSGSQPPGSSSACCRAL